MTLRQIWGFIGILLVVSISVVVFLKLRAWQKSPSNPNAPPLEICTDDQRQAAFAALPDYKPTDTDQFMTIQDGYFADRGGEFLVRGVNYYPSRFPWRRFLTESDIETVRAELKLLREIGLNTLRLFLWNEALFICDGDSAVPNADAFSRLDAFIEEAASQGFRLIITLNDLPDLTDYPLYADPAHIREQTAFIVQRYQDQPAILAWDLRNEGDIDYGSNNALGGKFEREMVLDWLATTSEFVRSLDRNHLITAGWLFDAESTAPYVDFVSFHHWNTAEDLRWRVADFRTKVDKPLLLEEVGHSSFTRTIDEQSSLLLEAVQTTESEGLLGWLIWTAFDFPLDATCIPPACPSADNPEHHFGLWLPDYTPKPIVGQLQALFSE